MRIAEIYRSVQGEGFLTGVESAFVRISGCNLRCWFCDTPYASWRPEGDEYSLQQVLQSIDALECRHVVITGGEPMLFEEVVPLTQALAQMGLHLTIETAGTVDRPVVCDLMSISPKLKNSRPSAAAHPTWHARHERTRHAPEVIRRLAWDYTYQLKFVIDRPADCVEVERYLEEFPQLDRQRVMLMPQGTEPEQLAAKAEWLGAYCRSMGLRFCPRRQIEWFGAGRGT